MSTCQAFPTKTKAQAIEGFCDEFPGFCSVSTSGVESVPSDVEKTILLDNLSTNDYNDCDGGFDFELACPTTCGRPETTVSATYRVVADAFGGGKECPYHDGFVMDRTCPATDPCPADCSGGEWSYTCPNYCGYEGGYTTKVWTGGTPAVGDGEQCPSPTAHYCPAKTCAMACGGYWGGWSECPSCGTTSSSHSQSRTWTTTSTLPSGYYYSPACPSPTTQTQYCPATPACTVELTYFNQLFKEWGEFVGDYSTYGNLVIAKNTSKKSIPVRSYYDPYPTRYIPGFLYNSDKNGMCSATTRNFYFKEPTGKLIRDVTCSIKWLANSSFEGNITPKKYRIYRKLYGSTDWTLHGAYTGASSADTDVTTTWTVSEPSIEYRMEVYEWNRPSEGGCYYRYDYAEDVSYYDTYYDVALSGYDGYVVVSGITMTTRDMDITYDDVEYIPSYEVRGTDTSGEDVLIYSDETSSWTVYGNYHSATINSSTSVKDVYVRLKLGRSTGRGDYVGETHDLSINVEAVKQI